ncbi:sensor histidine kinase [Brachybacterium phenoliresistens]|uniref:sensor histidine kinase n=1 Tax=Brachybacterium phenoliresistens TaxID=396014 RepID=UPI0031CE1F4E
MTSYETSLAAGEPMPPPDPSPPRRPHPVAAGASVIVWAALAWTWGIASVTLLTTGIASVPALGVGMLVLIPWLLLMRLAAAVERRRADAVHGLRVTVPPRRRSERTGLLGALHGLWLDVSSLPYWAATLHHHIAMLCAMMFGTLSLAALWASWTAADILVRAGDATLGRLHLTPSLLGILCGAGLLVAFGAIALGTVLDRMLARAFLSHSEQELKEQVTELTQRRQGAVDAAEQERLRIERDLHDGVQPRLVALAMTLGIAKSKIASDPETATALVDEAHREAKGVITDLRQLARGIHPAVLTDRGLDAALSALAARSPIPVDLHTDLPMRLGRETEGVAYFVVSEALTNIAKHSGASRATVRVRQQGSSLDVTISDDGRGGAGVHRGGLASGQRTGLAGLTDRVRAAGGTLELHSPPGGGTRLQALLPVSAQIAAAPGAAAPDASAAGAPAPEATGAGAPAPDAPSPGAPAPSAPSPAASDRSPATTAPADSMEDAR